jgi:hypothetical protein
MKNIESCTITDGRNRNLVCSGDCYANGGCRFMKHVPEPFKVTRYKADNGNLYYNSRFYYSYFRKSDGELIVCNKSDKKQITDPKVIFQMRTGILELAQGFSIQENRARANGRINEQQVIQYAFAN